VGSVILLLRRDHAVRLHFADDDHDLLVFEVSLARHRQLLRDTVLPRLLLDLCRVVRLREFEALCACRRAARSPWRMWTDSAVEFPFVADDLEARSRPRRGQHRGGQAGKRNATLHSRVRRIGGRGRPASRRVQRYAGPGREIGMALATHPGIAKVSFTGSTEVGIQVAAAAAKSVKRVTLELGGKSPAVICDDADIDRAVIGTAAGVFGHAGQKCAARTRCIVMESVADEVVARLAARAKLLIAGDTMDATTTLGPVINKAAQQKILGYCASGVAEGAQLICGGRAPEDLTGPYVEATIFDHAR